MLGRMMPILWQEFLETMRQVPLWYLVGPEYYCFEAPLLCLTARRSLTFSPFGLVCVLTVVSAPNVLSCPSHFHCGRFADGDNDGNHHQPSGGRRGIAVEKRPRRRTGERLLGL